MQVNRKNEEYFDEKSWTLYNADAYYVGPHRLRGNMPKLVIVHHHPDKPFVVGLPPFSDWAQELINEPDKLLERLQKYANENDANIRIAMSKNKSKGDESG